MSGLACPPDAMFLAYSFDCPPFAPIWCSTPTFLLSLLLLLMLMLLLLLLSVVIVAVVVVLWMCSRIRWIDRCSSERQRMATV
jgi:hypothetical protein